MLTLSVDHDSILPLEDTLYPKSNQIPLEPWFVPALLTGGWQNEARRLATPHRQSKEVGALETDQFMPLDEYRRRLRLANWEAFNTALYLRLAQISDVQTAAQELKFDWAGYFGEHVLRLADQTHLDYTERGIGGSSWRTLAEHTMQTITHLKELQEQKVKAKSGQVYSPDRAILEAEIVKKVTELKKTNKWIVFISPRGEEHHLYPGTQLENYVVIYVIKGNEFHQLMTWHTNSQLAVLEEKLGKSFEAQEIVIPPHPEIGHWTPEMLLERVFALDSKTDYQKILNLIYEGKETWVINPDESLTSISQDVVELQAQVTGNILEQLFLEFMSGNQEIDQAAGSLSKRQQLNLLTEVIQEKFASLAFQTQMRLNQFNSQNSADFQAFYDQEMQKLIHITQTITPQLIRSIWLARLKEESGQTKNLTPEEKHQLQKWNSEVLIPRAFGKTTSLLHCGIGAMANPNLISNISSIGKLQAEGFNLSQINLIREWQSKGYQLVKFEHNGQIIAYMVPPEYLKGDKMYFDPNIGDVIGPCGIPLSQDPLAYLVMGQETLSGKTWFENQKHVLINTITLDKREKVQRLLKRIERAVFVDTMGFDRFLVDDTVKNNIKARIVYVRLRELLGNVAPHNLLLVVDKLLTDEVLLKNLEELETELGLREKKPNVDKVMNPQTTSGITDVSQPSGVIYTSSGFVQ